MSGGGTYKRIAYFDYLKALLIFLVVFGHMIALKKTLFSESLYQLIFAFHMPLFVLISGYFAKPKFKSGSYFILYIFFSIFNYIISLFKGSINLSLYSFLRSILYPQLYLWYLFSLIVWLTILKFIKKVKIWHIIVTILVSLLAGFFGFINSFLSLSRIFYFMPFLFIGKYLSQHSEKLQKVLKNKNIFLIIFSIVFLCLSFVFIYFNIDLFSGNVLYGYYPYKNGFASCLFRLLIYVWSSVLCFSVMYLVPYKDANNLPVDKTNIIQKIGQNTLTIYLFHGFIVLEIRSFISASISCEPLFIVACLAISLIIILLTSTKPFVKFINLFLKTKKKSVASENSTSVVKNQKENLSE